MRYTKDEVVAIVDSVMHKYASVYRRDAVNDAGDIMRRYDSEKNQANEVKSPTETHCHIGGVSTSFCSHIMTRNPKENQENKCRLCGKPYQNDC